MEAAYNGFVESVISLCYGTAMVQMPQSQWLTPKTNCSTIIHCMKLIEQLTMNLFVHDTFIRKMRNTLPQTTSSATPLSAIRTH